MTWLTFPPQQPNPADPLVAVTPSRVMQYAITIDGAKHAARQFIASSRYSLEIGGIEINGVSIKTDRESQATITGALLKVMRDPSALIDWKGANGWVRLSADEIGAIADAVANHVQACFTAERVKADALDALTTIEEIRNFDCRVTL